MWLFVGLGNPEPQYGLNRHNVGFRAVETIHDQYHFSSWKREDDAQTSEGRIADQTILILKPTTFMNESGRAVAQALRFQSIALRNVIAFHDDVELPPGKVRIKLGGGDKGHKGLRSITSKCGRDYIRVHIGIGRPADKRPVHSHVLSDFTRHELSSIDTVCDMLSRLVPSLVSRVNLSEHEIDFSLREVSPSLRRDS